MSAKTISCDLKTSTGEKKHFPSWLLAAFVALGPLGNIFTPEIFPAQFRTYYFLLPLFPLFFTTIHRKQVMLVLFFAPFLAYSLFSVIPVEIGGKSNLPFPLFRYFLLLTQFLFVLGAAYHASYEKIKNLIAVYLKAFFISVVFGYVFFIGYYLSVVSLEMIERYSVVTQIGYGLLRFSPGSYPNEYGIVSSFVLSILVLSSLKNENILPKRFFYLLFLLTVGALCLATTRAAYLALLFSVFYIAWKEGCFLRIFKFLLLALAMGGIALKCLGVDPLGLFIRFFSIDVLQSGSVESRFVSWQRGYEEFSTSPFLGTGFAVMPDLHNVYLQALFEFGIIGLALFSGAALAVYFGLGGKRTHWCLNGQKTFLEMVQTIGWIHVLWFAASNHNVNHHLTWFVIFLTFSWMMSPVMFHNHEQVFGGNLSIFKK